MSPDAPLQPVGQVEIVGSYGFTGQETVGFESDKAREKLRQASIERGAERTYESVTKIDQSVATIDSALDALADDANVGPIYDMLPTFKESTKRFQTASSRMGLDVVSSVKFGALSAGELKVAMSVAIPPGLTPASARTFLEDKKSSQLKLRGFLLDMADRSMSENKTPAEIMIEHAKQRRKDKKNKPTSSAPKTSQSAADKLKALEEGLL